MENKLSVKVCTGTLCYVMGGAELQLLESYLPAEIAARVDIKGAPCLDCCNRTDAGKAPFVQVGDRIVAEASLFKVAEVIKEMLKAEGKWAE